MIGRALLLTCALVVFTPIAANADGVDVNPAKLKPRLFLKVTRTDKDRNVSDPGPGRKQKPPPKFRCFPDEFGLGTECAPMAADPPGQPALTEGAILEAVREIGLPSLTVRIQPGTSTLVNIPTIFYTQPRAFQRSVTLLGYDIDLVANPIRYTWRHGDGTTSTTNRPGRPYPAMDVTYRYREPADTVKPRVDVTYRVRYRVDGGTWTTLGQTLLASGPATVLEVKEAAPVLTTP